VRTVLNDVMGGGRWGVEKVFLERRWWNLTTIREIQSSVLEYISRSGPGYMFSILSLLLMAELPKDGE